MSSTSRKDLIKQKLAILNPHILEVVDQSAMHRGHPGVAGMDGQTHFLVKIAADSLGDKNRVEKHRIINKLLQEEFDKGLHALSIQFL